MNNMKFNDIKKRSFKYSLFIFVLLTACILSGCTNKEDKSSDINLNKIPPAVTTPSSPSGESPSSTPKDDEEIIPSEGGPSTNGNNDHQTLEKEGFIIKIETVFKKLSNFIIDTSYASDEPYCDEVCNTDSCLYLYEIDSKNKTEMLLCSINKLQSNKAEIKIYNYEGLENKVFEIRNYNNLEQTAPNLISDEAQSKIFSINQDHLIQKSMNVVTEKELFFSSFFIKEDLVEFGQENEINNDYISEIESKYNEKKMTTFIQEVILENDEYAYEDGDESFIFWEIIQPNMKSNDFLQLILSVFQDESDLIYSKITIESYISNEMKNKNLIREKKKKEKNNKKEKGNEKSKSL